jgi:uncharacterized protein (DUF983 family)
MPRTAWKFEYLISCNKCPICTQRGDTGTLFRVFENNYECQWCGEEFHNNWPSHFDDTIWSGTRI